jgi:hypothetical protein
MTTHTIYVDTSDTAHALFVAATAALLDQGKVIIIDSLTSYLKEIEDMAFPVLIDDAFYDRPSQRLMDHGRPPAIHRHQPSSLNLSRPVVRAMRSVNRNR